jgi:hypothetical protein
MELIEELAGIPVFSWQLPNYFLRPSRLLALPPDL